MAPASRTLACACLLVGLLATTAGGALAEEDAAHLRIAASDAGCPGDRELCLLVVEGNPRTLEPGREITVVYENRGSQPHTLHVARLEDADPHRETPGHAAFAATGPHGVDPAREQTTTFTVPDDADGLYLWCAIEDHEARGMWIEAPLRAADEGSFDGAWWALVGGIGALGLAVLAWLKRRRIWILLAGLYTRLTKREILQHEERERIVELVEDEPGIHFRQLARRLDAGHGILGHHLRKLEEAGAIQEHATDSHRCYFPTGRWRADQREALANVKASGARSVLAALDRAPGLSLTEIADEVGLARSTVSHHVSRLTDVGVIETERDGRSKRLRLTSLGSDVLDLVEGGEGDGRRVDERT